MISVCAIVLVASFVFLRLYGVPGPILREVVRRVNDAGIPIDVERVTLSLHGWRAENVGYYSGNPDDLRPLVHAREVLVARLLGVEGNPEKRWNIHVEAIDVGLCPSIDWGIHIPESSPCRTIDDIELTIGFAPDRLEFTDGKMKWLGVDFSVNGRFIKPLPSFRKAPASALRDKARTWAVSEEQFRIWENKLKRIRLLGGAVVEVDFEVDANKLEASRLDYRMTTDEIMLRQVAFSRAELSGYYAYPSLVVDQAALFMGNQSVRAEAGYHFEHKEIQGSIKNSITSKELLSLLPPTVLDLLLKARLQFEHLPEIVIGFGPATPNELLNSVDGRFSIQDVTYSRLLIKSLRGKVSRADNVLKLTQLQGHVNGQEEFSGEVGSCLEGGYARGEVFWDANTEEFGVSASGSFDPNLLIQPLAIVPIATNVIDRFKFKDKPPQVSLELGSNYTDWSTFYINVQASGQEVKFHDALLSTVNATAFYKKGILRLEPVAAMSGADFLKGTASVNFKESSVWFDVFGTLQPAVIEDGVYSRFNLFGNRLNTSGNVQIKALGTLDWKTMQKTDFVAEVEADRLKVPVAHMDEFSGTVVGKGPLITVTNAVCRLYGGAASGTFSVRLDPAEEGIPYALDATVKNSEFRNFLLFVNPDIGDGVAGTLSGRIAYDADLTKDFFTSANGEGQVSVNEGQLADLPFFSGFSRLVRKIIPGFNAFSITSLRGDFSLDDGVISTENAYFGGDVISAKGRGSYSTSDGFDAYVHGQFLNDNRISKVLRAITDPIFKLFATRLTGPLSDPNWEMDKYKSSSGHGKAVEE